MFSEPSLLVLKWPPLPPPPPRISSHSSHSHSHRTHPLLQAKLKLRFGFFLSSPLFSLLLAVAMAVRRRRRRSRAAAVLVAALLLAASAATASAASSYPASKRASKLSVSSWFLVFYCFLAEFVCFFGMVGGRGGDRVAVQHGVGGGEAALVAQIDRHKDG